MYKTCLNNIGLLILSCFISCTSDFDFKNETFESLLVIDATITNEFKQHEILLNLTFAFDQEPVIESDANVILLANGSEINFTETDHGVYKSDIAFRAEATVEYQLKIETSNGKKYSSTIKKLTTQTNIDEINIERITNDDGIDGMAMFVSSFDPTNTSKFYKYEFVETFKVIAPDWVDEDAIVISDVFPDCEVGLIPRSKDKITCYRTEISNQLNINSTSSLSEDRVEEHLVRFLSNQDYKISHRYSLLLRQFVLSQEGYNYLEMLDRFTSQGSLFSQVQTGFLVGNIVSETDTNEKVIGFFEVASVNEQRVFFNYRDYYPTGPLPPYITDCFLSAPSINIDPQRMTCGGLINILPVGNLIYLRDYDGNPPFANAGPYYLVPRACGDCTALGTNVVPDFWVE